MTARDVPRVGDHFVMWRGRMTHPDATTSPGSAEHDRICVAGWIASGDWWLHCGTCRPESSQPARKAGNA